LVQVTAVVKRGEADLLQATDVGQLGAAEGILETVVMYWAVEGYFPAKLGVTQATGAFFRVMKVRNQAVGVLNQATVVVNPVTEGACRAIVVVSLVVPVMLWAVVGLSQATVASGILDSELAMEPPVAVALQPLFVQCKH
jgi:hypothetical protein